MFRSNVGRTVSARVDESDLIALARLAARHDRSVSREVARAIRFYLADASAAATPTPPKLGPESDADDVDG